MKRKRLSTKVLFDRRENPIFRVLNTLGLYIYLPLFINQNKETETRNKGEKKIQNLESFSFFSCILSQTNIGFNENTKRRRNPCLKNKITIILSPVWLPRKPEKSEKEKNHKFFFHH
jgi:hypothetical protein